MPNMRPFFIPRIINPHSDDENAIRNLVITIQALILVAVTGITLFLTVSRSVTLILAGLIVVTIVLAWRGIVSPGQILMPIAIVAVSTIFMLGGNGLHDIAAIGLAGAIIIAGLFLGSRGAIITSIIAVLIMTAMGAAEMTGIFKPVAMEKTSLDDIAISAIIFIVIGFSLRTTLNRLKNVANKARENEIAQITTNRELVQLKNSLEARVDERTRELEKRASQLEAISRVSRSISSIQDLEVLLPSITRVVSEQFGFYHTGIFLLDERSEYAALVAASSEGGQRMLQRGHRLQVGTTGMVGFATAQGEPRIALDVGADAVYFNNPDLPNTRSEIALPLFAGTEVIGALDVQSTETNAFQPEDISVLSTLANQVAIAINNSRLFSQTRKALSESQNFYEQYIKNEWSRFNRSFGSLGFTYDGIRTVPIVPDADNGNSGTRIPIKVRGLPIGEIAIRSNDPHRQWTPYELSLAQAAADRAGLAIENARLLNDAQRRAAKERTIGEISSRLSTSIDMNDIMRSAVEEIGRSLAGSEVVLQLQTNNDRANRTARDDSK